MMVSNRKRGKKKSFSFRAPIPYLTLPPKAPSSVGPFMNDEVSSGAKCLVNVAFGESQLALQERIHVKLQVLVPDRI